MGRTRAAGARSQLHRHTHRVRGTDANATSWCSDGARMFGDLTRTAETVLARGHVVRGSRAADPCTHRPDQPIRKTLRLDGEPQESRFQESKAKMQILFPVRTTDQKVGGSSPFGRAKH